MSETEARSVPEDGPEPSRQSGVERQAEPDTKSNNNKAEGEGDSTADKPQAAKGNSNKAADQEPGGDNKSGDNQSGSANKRRRRGSRGGRNRSKSRSNRSNDESTTTAKQDQDQADDRAPDEMPDRHREGKPASVEAANKSVVRKAPPSGPPTKPKIGDTLPAPEAPQSDGDSAGDTAEGGSASTSPKRRRRRRRRGSGGGNGGNGNGAKSSTKQPGAKQSNKRGSGTPIEAMLPSAAVDLDLDDDALDTKRGRRRKGRPVGRYQMCVHVTDKATQIAVLEGRALIEHYVSHPSDDISQIHGNVYLGRVQNVLPGMEAAFVDIGTPKNAVLYRGDLHFDIEDLDQSNQRPRIEQVLKGGQTIVCQVTKNPIGAKGARLTQEVSLPGRFVVLIPNSSTYGISKRLPDDERRRLRQVLDRVKPAQHGMIVRTAAEGVSSNDIENDVRRLLKQWEEIDKLAKRSKAPQLLYREPEMAVRVIREEFNQDYRGIIIDDRTLYEAVRDYVGSISPTLVDRVQFYDNSAEKLPLFERHHVHEQLHRALDRKVWLPSGGSLIIEHTEALTVIDVNTGKNVGKSSLEETVFRNNLEAAVEVARQLRLRDVGGIIVVDFIDMEIRENREEVTKVFREALSRDKTRTQVFEISELGLCEMTRKRIGEGLLESLSQQCPMCEGRGVQLDEELLPNN